MKWMIMIIILLQIIDIILTTMVISFGGFELNPVPLTQKAVYGGAFSMIALKLFVFIPIVYGVGFIYPRIDNEYKKANVQGVFTGLMLWFIFVAFWNMNQLFKVL